MCLEGSVIESIQLIVLGVSVFLSLKISRRGNLIVTFFLIFVFFEEINWCYEIFPQSIKNCIIWNSLPLTDQNLSIHNMYGHKVEGVCIVILILILVFPRVLDILSFRNKSSFKSMLSLNRRIYLVSIFATFGVNVIGGVIEINKPCEHANEEYFELMLYLWFAHLLFSIILKKKRTEKSFGK